MPLSWVVEILWSGVHFHYNNNPLHFTLNDSREQFRCKLKKRVFCKILLQISCLFKVFCTKNDENYYFNQRLECAAPKCWSKYTTAAIPKIRRTEWKWKPTRSIQLLKIKKTRISSQKVSHYKREGNLKCQNRLPRWTKNTKKNCHVMP